MFALSIIPSHSIAIWLVNTIDSMLDAIGLYRYRTAEEIIYVAIITFVAFAIGWLIRRMSLWMVKKAVKLRNTSFCNDLLQQHTLTKCSHMITPLVLMALIPFAFESSNALHTLAMRIVMIYSVVTVGYALQAIMTFVFTRYDRKENTRDLPLRGILNVCVGVCWGLVVIVSISIGVDKSPATLLGGLTAFAAVLMLIFKDTILGFVAGIQMSNNDMVRVGDWIVVPSTMANGIVEDVSLTTVKVRNFDNTIVMVPPYTLVSTCVQNWRGMSESGVRRICENIYINPDTIKTPDADMIKSLHDRYPTLQPFIDRLQQSGQLTVNEPGVAPVNGSLETNLGLFRAYMGGYLVANEMINHTMDLMVCITSPTHEGVPLQIYCFAKSTQWEQYSGIKSAILEHAMNEATNFGLEILSADHLNVTTEQND